MDSKTTLSHNRRREYRFIFTAVLIFLILPAASAHHDETWFKDVFADVPYRVQGSENYVPVLVDLKDAIYLGKYIIFFTML